jgi:hypothetical protein
MSPLGHSRGFDPQPLTSDLPSSTDITGQVGPVCAAKSGHRQPLHLTISSALATNVGVAVLIVTSDKTTATPTKSRYSPSSKNIASASLYCGGKFEN